MNYEEQYHKIEVDLVELFFTLKAQVEEMETREDVFRPDYRYLEIRLNELKHFICNHFGYAPIDGNSIEKHRDDHVLMNAMKLADKYKK